MNAIDKIYEAIGIDTKNKVDDLLHKLQQIPRKDKGVNIPHTEVFEKNSSQQADLLSMPNDNGYKYILVVVDLATKAVDAEPLKRKTPDAVLQALKKIYSRKYLNIPKDFLGTDQGTEFKGVVKEYMNNHGVIMKYGKAGRHRQQAVVEAKNYLIGKVLNTRMLGQELLTNETSREWVEDLPRVIKAMNKHLTKPEPKGITPSPMCQGDSCNLLDKGTKVRIILDEPKDIHGHRLHGKFRAGDLRYDRTIRTIEQIYIRPNQPPTYRVSRIPNVAYTRNQLQLVSKKEKLPSHKLLRRHFIERIIGREMIKGRIFYKVKWIGYKDPTLEPRNILIKDVPQMIKEFERSK